MTGKIVDNVGWRVVVHHKELNIYSTFIFETFKKILKMALFLKFNLPKNFKILLYKDLKGPTEYHAIEMWLC